MVSIVHQDQTCGVLGRTIFSNLHLVRDVLDFIDKTNEPAILIALDKKKAFDHVDHKFMLCVLCNFGFGPSFCHWVETFYAHAFSRILVNRALSSPVYLHRGVRQGAPYLLFSMFSFQRSCQLKSVNVRKLMASCSLEPGAFNFKFHNMKMMPLRSFLFCICLKLCIILNWAQELN